MPDRNFGEVAARPPLPINLHDILDYCFLDLEYFAEQAISAPDFPKVFDDHEADLICVELIIKMAFDWRAKKNAEAAKGVSHAE